MEQQPITYLFVHLIWPVKERKAALTKPVCHVLFAFIKSKCQEKLIRLINISGTEDHIHVLLQLHPTLSLSRTIREIQQDSAAWINENKFMPGIFEWDEAFIAYSVSPSQVKQVSEYIDHQEAHHKTRTLESELESFEKIKI